jgi:hypothetical protein
MVKTACTPRELEDVVAFLAPVPADRHADIARMMFEEVGTCPVCHEAVRCCDPRRLHRDRLRHLGCGGAI